MVGVDARRRAPATSSGSRWSTRHRDAAAAGRGDQLGGLLDRLGAVVLRARVRVRAAGAVDGRARRRRARRRCRGRRRGSRRRRGRPCPRAAPSRARLLEADAVQRLRAAAQLDAHRLRSGHHTTLPGDTAQAPESTANTRMSTRLPRPTVLCTTNEGDSHADVRDQAAQRVGHAGRASESAAGISAAVGDAPGSGVRWIRSYVLGEENGELGTVCIYEGESPRRCAPTPRRSECRRTRSRRWPTPS